jgi:TetR/AcrR family transcriptional regulator, tetracycline repressor protein
VQSLGQLGLGVPTEATREEARPSGVARSRQNGGVAERALNADEVVRAALALLDEVGLRGFTMRALAQRLGTYPATIYWHVGSRTDVLWAAGDLVLHEAMTGLPDPETTPWDEWLAETARAYRRVMQAHPALAQAAVTHLDAEVTVPDVLERVVGVLARAGFRGAPLAAAYNAYMGSLGGWVGMEMIADDPEMGSNPERMEASVHELSADDYPIIVANLDHLADQAFTFRWHGGATRPMNDAFEFALATWIEGLRAMLQRTT